MLAVGRSHFSDRRISPSGIDSHGGFLQLSRGPSRLLRFFSAAKTPIFAMTTNMGSWAEGPIQTALESNRIWFYIFVSKASRMPNDETGFQTCFTILESLLNRDVLTKGTFGVP